MTASSQALRILLVHNFYGSSAPSGENMVFEAEKSLLTSRGHEVAEFTRHSDEILAQGVIGLLRGAAATAWNPASARSLKRAVKEFQADVVHVHNTFPLLSPSIFSAVGELAARVLTLHNYRLFCAAAIPMRNQNICTLCLDKRSSLPALRYGCYRGSWLATLPLASSIALHRSLNTWTRHVDGFIALSDFQRELMASAGLPKQKIHVKGNFYPGKPLVRLWRDRAPHVIFAGRLSPEKGVETLLRAWRLWGGAAPTLRLAGDGPLRQSLERIAEGLPVSFLGQISGDEVLEEIASAQLVVLPSEWFEGFPMVIREAFAFGTPVATTDLGPLPSLVQHGISGIVFKSGSPESLMRAIRQAWESPGLLEQLGNGARVEFESKHTEEVNYATLMHIYQRAILMSSRGDVHV